MNANGLSTKRQRSSIAAFPVFLPVFLQTSLIAQPHPTRQRSRAVPVPRHVTRARETRPRQSVPAPAKKGLLVDLEEQRQSSAMTSRARGFQSIKGGSQCASRRSHL